MGISDDDVTFVVKLLREVAAFSLDSGKSYLIEARLSALAHEEGLSDPGRLIHAAKRAPAGPLARRIVEAMLTHETAFFRDLHPFETLRQPILPELRQLRSTSRRLNILCVACSSGQEPYSIALLLREHFPDLMTWDLRIIAGDLSQAIIDRAKTARFTQLEVSRGLPATMLVKYFRRIGVEWELREDVRRLVQFQTMNLTTTWPYFPQFDVIFMRNVLIYLEEAARRRILARARQALAPEGTLFLGSNEYMSDANEEFERVFIGKTTCFRQRVDLPPPRHTGRTR